MTSVVGLVLYGSYARGDQHGRSDVDLLAVTDGGSASRAVLDRVSICCYPLHQVVRHARWGDLFVLHIVSEGRVLYQLRPVLDEIADAFVYRDDYTREIELVSDVGWFLVRHGEQVEDPRQVNQKMAWCTRTILVARAAALRRPVFSASGLAGLAGSPDVAAVIENKSSDVLDLNMVARFSELLRRFGSPGPPPLRTLDEQRRVFEAQRNAVGVTMVRAVTENMRTSASPEPEVPLDARS